jgi:6-phosphogluconolactonase/glucosamine-6-phosphate isomerase/deaminase
MHIEHCANPSVAAEKAGDALSRSVKETTAPMLLLLSGGSALKVLDYVKPDMFSSRVTIGVLDERVSTDPAINNYLQLLSHPAIVRARAMGSVTINTVPFDHETPQELAGRFEHTLRQWSSEHPDGKIIATVGMGPDGHTFGMMPYPEDKTMFDRQFVETDHWVVGYDAGSKHMYPLRATTTVAFSNEIYQSIWYVCGHDKTAMLNKTLDPKTDIHNIPARIIQDMHNVTLFTDCPITE